MSRSFILNKFPALDYERYDIDIVSNIEFIAKNCIKKKYHFKSNKY